jgi:hypothetical protein
MSTRTSEQHPKAHASTPRDQEAGGGRFPRVVAIGVGSTFVLFGAWAFFAPRSFFDALATFEPYNAHFIHDLGAFQIGLGAVLLFGAFARDALLTALAGVAVGGTFHLLAHIVDRDLGGTPATDIPFFAVLVALLIAAAGARVMGAPGRR